MVRFKEILTHPPRNSSSEYCWKATSASWKNVNNSVRFGRTQRFHVQISCKCSPWAQFLNSWSLFQTRSRRESMLLGTLEATYDLAKDYLRRPSGHRHESWVSNGFRSMAFRLYDGRLRGRARSIVGSAFDSAFCSQSNSGRNLTSGSS